MQLQWAPYCVKMHSVQLAAFAQTKPCSSALPHKHPHNFSKKRRRSGVIRRGHRYPFEMEDARNPNAHVRLQITFDLIWTPLNSWKVDLITQRSVVQIHPPQLILSKNPPRLIPDRAERLAVA